MRYEEVLVTPEIARKWLDKNFGNRRIKSGRVSRYIQDIKADRWPYTADPMHFDTFGRLRNGQHRLSAIIAANMPLKCLIVYDFPPESADALDRGGSRSNADRFEMATEKNAVLLAGTLKILYLYEVDKLGSAQEYIPIEGLKFAKSKYPDVQESIMSVRKESLKILAPFSVLAAMHCLFWDLGGEKTLDFFAGLETGANLDTGNPILTLRDQLLKLRRNKKVKKPTNQTCAWFIKSWNAFCKDEKIKLLRWRGIGKASNEAFPRAVSAPDETYPSEQKKREIVEETITAG